MILLAGRHPPNGAENTAHVARGSFTFLEYGRWDVRPCSHSVQMPFQLQTKIQSSTAMLLPNHAHLSRVFSHPTLQINAKYKQSLYYPNQLQREYYLLHDIR